MKTLRRLIYTEVLASVLFVALGFLALFFFFDFVDELPNVGRNGADGYQVTHALAYVALLLPSHLYELLPIAVLIGTIFVMARLAQSSEYTILRTSGLGPWKALRMLMSLGLLFVLLTFATGDYLAPVADRTAQLLKTRTSEEGMAPLSAAAVARLATYSARLAEHQGRLSARIGDLFQLVSEADFIRQLAKDEVTDVGHIERALKAKATRTGRVPLAV